MGMTKALQERIFTAASLHAPRTRFVVVRYGNVLASRGSVVPLFLHQIRSGGPVTITHPDMTRFLLSLDDAVNIIFDALSEAGTSEIYVPHIKSARVLDIATALIDKRPIKTTISGVRPGEKLHEVLISAEEGYRTFRRGRYLVVSCILPELRHAGLDAAFLAAEYSSASNLMTFDEVRDLLIKHALMTHDVKDYQAELLR